MRATTHHSGKVLTGLTYGKRGGAIYARVYDKTREADADAAIRERWAAAAGQAVPAGEVVWRIEFEVRSALLNGLADERAHLSRDPRDLLATRLDDIWRYLTTKWLVLKDPGSASRIERCAPEPWWDALSCAQGLSEGACSELERRPQSSDEALPLLRQMRGLLAAYGARVDDATLAGCLARLTEFMERQGGQTGFAEAVERARLRLPLSARSQDAARRRAAGTSG